MSAGQLRMPAVIAWLFFAPGAALIVASIVRLQIDGLTVLGAVFLIIWVWLIGGFTREFWATQTSPVIEAEKWEPVDWALGSTTADERAHWRAVSEHFNRTP